MAQVPALGQSRLCSATPSAEKPTLPQDVPSTLVRRSPERSTQDRRTDSDFPPGEPPGPRFGLFHFYLRVHPGKEEKKNPEEIRVNWKEKKKKIQKGVHSGEKDSAGLQTTTGLSGGCGETASHPDLARNPAPPATLPLFQAEGISTPPPGGPLPGPGQALSLRPALTAPLRKLPEHSVGSQNPDRCRVEWAPLAAAARLGSRLRAWAPGPARLNTSYPRQGSRTCPPQSDYKTPSDLGRGWGWGPCYPVSTNFPLEK
ncbi:hypothetical protein GH733_007198 [Mirounga leonina]|nr:hypothetical protein GH733_007198 [Mirounga leonina]